MTGSPARALRGCNAREWAQVEPLKSEGTGSKASRFWNYPQPKVLDNKPQGGQNAGEEGTAAMSVRQPVNPRPIAEKLREAHRRRLLETLGSAKEDWPPCEAPHLLFRPAPEVDLEPTLAACAEPLQPECNTPMAEALRRCSGFLMRAVGRSLAHGLERITGAILPSVSRYAHRYAHSLHRWSDSADTRPERSA